MRIIREKLLTGIVVIALIASFSTGFLFVRGISTNVNGSSFSAPNLSAQDTFWPGNSSEWTEVAPETQGLNSSNIAEMFEFINSTKYDIHSIIIVRNGYLLTYDYLENSQIYRNMTGEKEYFFGGLLHFQASTTKSLMSILVGIALQEGFLDNVNQTLYEFFADIWNSTFTHSEQKKSITIEQLLTMTSGLSEEGPGYPSGAEIKIANDSIKFALDEVPLVFTPGQEGAWEYSNDGPTLLSGIISNVTGNSAEEFAREYLFEPLGILEEEYFWYHDNKSVSNGGYGFVCSPKVQAKLGMLCLNDGNWNGIQIADKDFMKDATTRQTTTDLTMGYGYLFYIDAAPEEAYFTYGSGGQSIYVIPKYNMVVGFTGFDLWLEYNTLLANYILKDVVESPVNQTPEDPIIPGFDLNLIFLVVFCASVVLVIRRKRLISIKIIR